MNVARGTLALTACEDCGFIFNRAFDPSMPIYGEGYENSQAFSPSFNSYMDGLVRHLIVERNVRDCQVIEVGCGNGLFLRKLVAHEGSGNHGYGFDPSYLGPDVDLDGRLKFFARYYDADCADIEADVVISRHVIEHVSRPLALLRSIRKALKTASSTRLFFETPCVEWILRNQIIWDFFYEHCSYFSADSLTTAFNLAGFEVLNVTRVFSDQYLWLEAKVSNSQPAVIKRAGGVSSLANKFALAEASLKRSWEKRIQTLAVDGKVALWGAGAKGVTFANLIDPERCLIDCVVDLNPQKQGHFVPGTGHPIVSYHDLVSRKVTTAILMNPNYRDENLRLLRTIGAKVRMVEG